MKVAVVPVLLFLTCWLYTPTSAKLTIDDVVKDINKYLDTGRKTTRFRHTVDMLKLDTPLKFKNQKIDMKIMHGKAGSGTRRKVPCGVCTLAMTVALSWLRNGNTRDQIVTKAIRLCTVFNIQKEPVCKGFVESHVDLALFMNGARTAAKRPASASEVCGMALYPECAFRGSAKAHYEWSFDLDYLGPKPELKPPQPLDRSIPTMEVLHITDVHVDPNYMPGSNALCDEPTCCRNDTLGPIPEGGAAGYWGDYRDCDSPFHAFANLVQQAAKTHPNVSYVMFTGDAVDHAMWVTGQDRNTDVYERVIEEIRSHFPDVPLLPAIGNHEPHPVNVWVDFEEESKELSNSFDLSTDWVYELAADTWSKWLPKAIRSSVQQGGSYAYEVKPGLLVVSLNNNFCYTFNWWLMYKAEDPAGQLKWLADTLKKAEEEGQKVHILAHIAGNTYNCLQAWRRQYQRIIHRFEDTVVAQFHGHDHTDYFALYYDPTNKTRPANVAFVAGSATAFTNVNPNYRVYTIEAQDGYRVLDHENWYYNLTEANLGGPDTPPNWKKLYSFNEAYGTESLLLQDLDGMVNRMAVDSHMQEVYFRHTVREADTALAKGCDAKCMRHLVCDIVDPDPKGKSNCDLPKPPITPRPAARPARGKVLRDDVYQSVQFIPVPDDDLWDQDEDEDDDEEELNLDMILADLLVE